MNTSMQNKPGLVMAIALMTLVNGIFNIIWGIGMILNTAGFLLVCIPISPLPIILGGFEIAYALKLLADPAQPVQPSRAIAWWEVAAVLVLNVFSMVVGILVLVFYNDATVKEYFARLNTTQTPPPPTSPEPAAIAPVETAPEVTAPPAIEAPASPVKPRTVRKPAKK